jgi:hypothetical protein
MSNLQDDKNSARKKVCDSREENVAPSQDDGSKSADTALTGTTNTDDGNNIETPRQQKVAAYKDSPMPELTFCSNTSSCISDQKIKRHQGTKYDSKWREKYDELVNYRARTGHCRVPPKYNENPTLASWVARQRAFYKRMKEGDNDVPITEERVEMLNKLAFEWSIGTARFSSAYDWRQKFEELKEFHDREGHFRVDKDEYPQLSEFITTMRQHYIRFNDGKRSLLTEERVNEMERVGFYWDEFEEEWVRLYEELMAFKAREGHCHVPLSYADCPGLIGWMTAQRASYGQMKEGKDSHLTEEKVRKLNDIGFDWEQISPANGGIESDYWMQKCGELSAFHAREGHLNVDKIKDPGLWQFVTSFNQEWEEMFNQLVAFKARVGHCRVPQGFRENPRLALWVNRQRYIHGNGREVKSILLSSEKVRILDGIGFEWVDKPEVNDDSIWLQRYYELKQFKAREGHTRVPWRCSDNLSLSEWVIEQRQHYKWLREGKESSMTQQRIQALRAIDFEFVIAEAPDRSQTWYARYEELKQFQHQEGHCRVPLHYGNNRLGIWVATQKRMYYALQKGLKSSMTEERVRYLNEIGFEWALGNPNEALWMERYQQLKEFYVCQGHFRIPETNGVLKRWLHFQRHQYKLLREGKKTKIGAERLELLNALSVDWFVVQRGSRNSSKAI